MPSTDKFNCQWEDYPPAVSTTGGYGHVPPNQSTGSTNKQHYSISTSVLNHRYHGYYGNPTLIIIILKLCLLVHLHLGLSPFLHSWFMLIPPLVLTPPAYQQYNCILLVLLPPSAVRSNTAKFTAIPQF